MITLRSRSAKAKSAGALESAKTFSEPPRIKGNSGIIDDEESFAERFLVGKGKREEPIPRIRGGGGAALETIKGAGIWILDARSLAR